MRSPWLIAGAVLILAACSSRTSSPYDSDVTIQASTTPTSAVKYIEITVRQLSDGALVYDSGLQPSSDFQDTRQYLERTVALAGSTDFTFDADAFDTNQHLLKHGNTVQEATQPPGHATTILIVIDLNAGDTNPTSVADITAVTDNIPTIYPPTLTVNAGAYSLHYKATDLDLDTDAGSPIDSNETLTFFTAILAGNVDLSANPMPGLFTEGQDFTFSFNDDQPVKILSAVVDRLNQLTFAITVIDPASGAFQTVEMGEGYALFDGNISLPPTRAAHHARRTDDPTGPYTGPIAVAVLKHGHVGPKLGYSVEAIAHTDDSLVVTPNNVSYWAAATVASFNRYEEQPDGTGTIVVDYKLRVYLPVVPAATVDANNPAVDPNNPGNEVFVDTIKMSSDGAGHFVFGPDLAEAAVLAPPAIDGVSGDGLPGGDVEVDGVSFLGAWDPLTANDVSQANDQRQVYLVDSANPAHFAYPTIPYADDNELDMTLPDDIGNGDYFFVVCSFGRYCVQASGTFTVTAPNPEFPLTAPSGSTGALNGLPLDINESDEIVGAAGAFEDRAYLWPKGAASTPIYLPSNDANLPGSVAYGVNDDGLIVGYKLDAGSARFDQPLYWDADTLQPHDLPIPGGANGSIDAYRVNAKGTIIGSYASQSGTIPVSWLPMANGYAYQELSVPMASVKGKAYTSVQGINASGAMAGSQYIGVDDQGQAIQYYQAYVWPDAMSKATLLPAPAESDRYDALAINDDGIVVGRELFVDAIVNISGALPVAWIPNGGSYDAITLPLPAVADAGVALDVNKSGQILGYTIVNSNDLSSSYFTMPVIWTPDGNGGYTIRIEPSMYDPMPTAALGPRMNDAGNVIGAEESNDMSHLIGVEWAP